MKKNAFVFLLMLCMAVLCGCRADFDPAAFVQSELDLICREQYTDDFLSATGLTKETAAQRYADGIEAETAYFAAVFGIDLSVCGEEAKEELRAVCRLLCGHAKYEVGEAEETENGWRVSVTVWPVDTLRQFRAQEAGALLADWEARYNKGEFDAMTAEAYEDAWVTVLLNALDPRLGSISHAEPETVTVEVAKGEKAGQYVIAAGDLARVDGLLLAY